MYTLGWCVVYWLTVFIHSTTLSNAGLSFNDAATWVTFVCLLLAHFSGRAIEMDIWRNK